MPKRRYEMCGDGTSIRLDLDDDGTFALSEVEWNAEHTMGADASGRWEANSETLLLHVAKSSFGTAWHMWREGTTERAAMAGHSIVLGGVTMKMVQRL